MYSQTITLKFIIMRTLKSEIAKTNKVVKVATKKAARGYILYEGKSMINGANIVAIITTKTSNTKTGQMPQLWILNADLKPTDASKSKQDESVCGGCKLRQSLGGACYVNLGQAPNAIYKSYKNGGYEFLDFKDYNIFSGKSIRFGAYGDPYAIPSAILTKLKSVAKNNTAYTHQWKNENSEVLKSLSMASVDSIEEQKEAVKMGWRTFRVATEDTIIQDNEIICPNTTKGISCLDCGLCNGNESGAKNILIEIHGSWKKRFNKV